MKVRYTPRAAKDLERLTEFLRTRSPQVAMSIARAIRSTAVSLADQPLSGISTEDPAVRMRLVKKYRYKIFYTVSDQIQILHIRHPSRGPDWK